jgi:hypothetical protein
MRAEKEHSAVGVVFTINFSAEQEIFFPACDNLIRTFFKPKGLEALVR